MIKKIFSYFEILLIDWTRLASESPDQSLERLNFTYTVKNRIKGNIFNN